MSAICGWAGPLEERPETLASMLAAVAYRGDTSDVASAPGVSLGYRFFRGRQFRASNVMHSRPKEGSGETLCAVAGTLVPLQPSPAEIFASQIKKGGPDAPFLQSLDGDFAAAGWHGGLRRLTLLCDPFGVRSLYYVEHRGTLYFASELKQLLAIPALPVELDYEALHKYLTFSFVPGEAVPIKGVRRLLPGHVAVWEGGRLSTRPYFTLLETSDPALTDANEAAERVRHLGRKAVKRRLSGESSVGLYLSGGIDSSAVAVWLREAGADVRPFSLDFGQHNVEREHAAEVAEKLGLRLELVRVKGADVAAVFEDLVFKLDLPFGDAVTGPQYLLGQAAERCGIRAVWNGEGGDQLFGGWTSKPMLAAALYADLSGGGSREAAYLRSYHRFYGLEDSLYTPEFKARLGEKEERDRLLSRYLGDGRLASFLNRVRLTDISLKGMQNILPRAERMAGCFGLDIRVPLFDRELAEMSFSMPPQLKLHGACEKYVLKLAMQPHLSDKIVWRRKSGMSVPITDWIFDEMQPLIRDLLGPESLRRRGLFRPEYVARLAAGQDEPGETRRRRLGEKLWALAMLEAWLRTFYDRRGQLPERPL